MIEPITKRLERKIETGAPLTNKELICAIVFYREVSRLFLKSNDFKLALKYSLNRLYALESYALHRGLFIPEQQN